MAERSNTTGRPDAASPVEGGHVLHADARLAQPVKSRLEGERHGLLALALGIRGEQVDEFSRRRATALERLRVEVLLDAGGEERS